MERAFAGAACRGQGDGVFDEAREELHRRTGSATRGGTVILVGSGGSGKSALLGEVDERARRESRSIWRLQGRITERDVPGAGLTDLLGRTVVVGEGGADVAHAAAAHQAARDVLEVCTGPGLLLVDDAHLLDPLALRTLTAVAERWNGTDRWLVVAHRPTQRSDIGLLGRVLSGPSPIVLGPLAEKRVADRVAALVGREVDPQLVDQVVALTLGVPRYVDLVVQAWLAHDTPARHGHPVDDTAPLASVIEYVRSALVHLGPEARTLAFALASGASLAEPLLGLAIGLDHSQLVAAAQELRSAGLAAPSGDELLPVVDSSVARIVLPAERRLFHRRVAELLGKVGGPATVVAEHYRASGEPGPAAVDAMLAAGDALLGESPELAASWYTDAVTAGADPLSVAARRAEAAYLAGDVREALHHADTVAAEPTAPDRARALGVHGAAMASTGYWARSSRRYERTAELTEHKTAAASAIFASVGALVAGELERADALEARAQATIDRPAPLLIEAWFSVLDGLRHALGPAPETALVPLVEATELLAHDRHLVVVPDSPHAMAASIAVLLHEFPLAERILVRALEAGAGGALSANRHRLLLGWVALRSGRWQAADGVLEQVAGERASLPLRDELVALALDAGVARRTNDTERMNRVVPRAVDALLRHPVDLLSLDVQSEIYGCALRAGRAEVVSTWPTSVRHLLRELGRPPLWVWQHEWAVLQAAAGIDDVNSVLTRAAALDMLEAPAARLAPLAVAAGAWAAVAHRTVEPGRIQATAQALQHVGLVWEAAQLTGAAAGRAGNDAASRSLLGQARELRAAIPTQDSVEAPVTAFLSEREVEVAERVLAGLTYKEIGNELYISPKTVEHHVARIRTRLGATTRAEFLSSLKQVLEKA
jgi:DNA-binding CsgD family transcriptional regulator